MSRWPLHDDEVAEGKEMTEAEWLADTDPQKMLTFLRGKASERKLRLFAVACCRRIGRLLQSKALQMAVEVSEQRADGRVPGGQLAKVAQAIEHVWPGNGDFTLESYPQIAGLVCAAKGKRELRSVAFYAAMASGVGEKKKQIRLLHDIFGNPFRAMPPKRGSRKWLAQLRSWQTWNGGTIPKLAQGIYDERAFDRLPVLADALQDAGCTDEQSLVHLREPSPHVRGCWVIVDPENWTTS